MLDICFKRLDERLDRLGPRLDSIVRDEQPRYMPLTQLQDNVITVNTSDYRIPSQDLSLYNPSADKALQDMRAYFEKEQFGTPHDYTGRALAALDSYCSSCSD